MGASPGVSPLSWEERPLASAPSPSTTSADHPAVSQQLAYGRMILSWLPAQRFDATFEVSGSREAATTTVATVGTASWRE